MHFECIYKRIVDKKKCKKSKYDGSREAQIDRMSRFSMEILTEFIKSIEEKSAWQM